jgi:hypothetical protein
MARAQRLFDIASIVLGVASTVLSWTIGISLENQVIPTVLNGMVSSIALFVGFTMTAITLAVSRLPLKPSEDMTRISFVTTFLLLSVLLLFSSYVALMSADYWRALRWAMTGFGISIFTLFDFVVFLTTKFEKAWREDKSQ